MNLRELRPNLWLTELVLDVFDVRGAVIVGEKQVVVWDTLSHPRDMQGVTELAKGKPIYVVYSHADWDHCWGTWAFTGSLVIAHDDTIDGNGLPIWNMTDQKADIIYMEIDVPELPMIMSF